jgi:hypothetical protein
MTNYQPPNNDREFLFRYGPGAVLPLMQATIPAVVITIAIYAIAAMGFELIDPHKPALFAGIVTWIIQWFKLQRHWFNLTAIEHAIRDLADDGMLNNSVPLPVQEEAPRIIRIQLIKDNGHVSDTIQLPCDDEQLSTLAKGLLNGLPFSEKFWTGDGKPFSTNQFRELCDVMNKRGLCEFVNPNAPKQGRRLTDEGRAVMENFASPHSPTAEDEA